jgi:WD40 repeat protein
MEESSEGNQVLESGGSNEVGGGVVDTNSTSQTSKIKFIFVAVGLSVVALVIGGGVGVWVTISERDSDLKEQQVIIVTSDAPAESLFDEGRSFVKNDTKLGTFSEEEMDLIALDVFEIDPYSLNMVYDLYSADNLQGIHLVARGERTRDFDLSYLMPIFMSEDGEKAAFSAKNLDEMSFVVNYNGQEYGPYEKEPHLSVSPDGKHFSFVVSEDESRNMSELLGYENMMEDPEWRAECEREPECLSEDSEFWQTEVETVVTRLYVDGEPYGEYSGVSNVTYSPDSQHVAYAASKWYGKATEWYLYIDHEPVEKLPYPPGGNFFWYHFGNNRYAYVRYGSNYASHDALVDNGQVGEEQRSIEHVVFSPDGKRLAYTVKAGPNQPGRQLVVDGQTVFGPESGIVDVTWSPDGKHIAYAVPPTHYYSQDGNTETSGYMVLDGKRQDEDKGFRSVYNPTFSPDGSMFAYEGRIRGPEQGEQGSVDQSVLVVNGQDIVIEGELLSELFFSPDSQYVGYAVLKGNELWWITKEVGEII